MQERERSLELTKTVLVDGEELGKAAGNCLMPKSFRRVDSTMTVAIHLVGPGGLTNGPDRATEWPWLGVVTMFQGIVFCFAVSET